MGARIADLKAHVDIVGVVSEDLGPPAKRSGRWHMWRCPFHEDRNPSLGVTAENGRWYCFGCGRGGDVVDWLREYRRMDWTEVRAYLEGVSLQPPRREHRTPARPEPSPIPRPPVQWQAAAAEVVERCQAWLWAPEGKRAREFLTAVRCLSEETIVAWRLGYNPRAQEVGGLYVPPGIVIPCYLDGQVNYIKVKGARAGGYKQVKGGRQALFGLDYLEGKRALVIVESELDAILIWQEAGDLVDVVATGGATNKPHRRLLYRLVRAVRWIQAFDNDGTGRTKASEWAGFSQRVVVSPPPAKDPTEYVQAGGDLRRWVLDVLERYGLAEQRKPNTYPVTIIWPPGTHPATIHRQWWRRANGEIVAVYRTREELALATLCMEAMGV